MLLTFQNEWLNEQKIEFHWEKTIKIEQRSVVSTKIWKSKEIALNWGKQVGIYFKKKKTFWNEKKNRNLTFGCVAGYKNSLTFPKSSPLAINVLSKFLQTALISVPSACSGHMPIVWNERLQFCVAHLISLVTDDDVIWRHNVGFPGIKYWFLIHIYFHKFTNMKW